MGPELVAVEATEERYRVLRHEPSGESFDENGQGRWPADQFTYRLRNEGAIRIINDGEGLQLGAADGFEKEAIEMPADGVERTYELSGAAPSARRKGA